MKIIGIDPGLSSTGIGIVNGAGVNISGCSYGSINTSKKSSLPGRLREIYDRLFALLKVEKPDIMVVEDVFSLKQYPKSGIILGQVSGVILLAGMQIGMTALEVPVREAKKVLTGNGSATKMQLEKSVRNLLKLSSPIRPLHASDALGLALIGLYRCGRRHCLK